MFCKTMKTPVVAPHSRDQVVVSPAKLNLFLDILKRRSDGYHDIETVFERISLSDILRLKSIPSDEIIVTSDTADIPCDHNNLVYKAAVLIKKRLKIETGVQIHIEKNIPVGAGLGGGSSNAASTLLGLNKLFRLKLDSKTLLAYANELGSDVAFFIFDERFAVGRGRGGELEAVAGSASAVLWHVVFALPIKVLTRDVYEAWDGDFSGKSLRLTKKASDVNMLLSLLRRNKPVLSRNRPDTRQSLLNQGIYNGLTETVMKSYTFVSEMRADLYKSGLEYVHMSGSGPTLFTTFTRKAEAVKVFQKMSALFSDRCRVLLARTQ